jgi:hypothetical protein
MVVERVNVEVRALVFEYSIRDFFECQNVVEAFWFGAFLSQFREVSECMEKSQVEGIERYSISSSETRRRQTARANYLSTSCLS